jgi:hypothetical protein
MLGQGGRQAKVTSVTAGKFLKFAAEAKDGWVRLRERYGERCGLREALENS